MNAGSVGGGNARIRWLPPAVKSKGRRRVSFDVSGVDFGGETDLDAALAESQPE